MTSTITIMNTVKNKKIFSQNPKANIKISIQLHLLKQFPTSPLVYSNPIALTTYTLKRLLQLMNHQNTIEIRDETHLGIRDSEGEAPEESFSSP